MKMTFKSGVSTLFGGVIFGLGLSVSNMINPDIVISFLELQDLGLLLVLGFGVIISSIGYFLIPKIFTKPFFAEKFQHHNKILNKKTIFGAAIFGVGWGISGLCPGAIITAIATFHWKILFGFAAMLLGAYVEGIFFETRNK